MKRAGRQESCSPEYLGTSVSLMVPKGISARGVPKGKKLALIRREVLVLQKGYDEKE